MVKGKRSGSVAKKKAAKPGSASFRERLRRQEEMLTIVLQAVLRGRLLPSERKPIKQYLQTVKKEAKAEEKEQAVHRCPACRSPLVDPKVERCPWCSVLLTQMGR